VKLLDHITAAVMAATRNNRAISLVVVRVIVMYLIVHLLSFISEPLPYCPPHVSLKS
jgi:hypothetical protein